MQLEKQRGSRDTDGSLRCHHAWRKEKLHSVIFGLYNTIKKSRMARHLSLVYSLMISVFACFVAARCQWSVLRNAVDSYIDSQSTGALAQVFSTAPYRENNKEVDIHTGILNRPMKINNTRTIFDQDGCGTYTELIVMDPENPYVIGTHIHYNESQSSLMITLVDPIATTTGDWLFNASKTLEYILQQNWNTIPTDHRDSRDMLKAGADAYLDLWGNPNAPVPWGLPCSRLEGSAYLGKGLPKDSCNVGISGGN